MEWEFPGGRQFPGGRRARWMDLPFSGACRHVAPCHARDLIELAFKEGAPFESRRADGEKYQVRDRHQIALGKTCALVIGDRDLPRVLPLLTMRGITNLDPTTDTPASS